MFVGAFQLLVIVFLALFQITIISGHSMAPSLKDGQLTLVFKGNADYKTGDIITVDTAEYGVCIKRILGQTGDTIRSYNGKILKNGIEITPYTCKEGAEWEYCLHEGEYFIIGDNYDASIDSRDYGPVMQEDIIGKVIFY